MPEFECFVSGATGAVIAAENSEDAKRQFFELLKSELSTKDIIAVEVEAQPD